MQVRYDEGVAIHIGPEPCVAIREGGCEASVGECIGQPLSLEKIFNPGADAFAKVEGNTDGRANASTHPARRGRRPWHVQTLFVWEPGGPASGQYRRSELVRIGKARSCRR